MVRRLARTVVGLLGGLLAVTPVLATGAAQAAGVTAQPDVVVTFVGSTPNAYPVAGLRGGFQATIKNIGTASSPSGVIHGVVFRVDGGIQAWSDSFTGSIPPGGSVTVTSNGGKLGHEDGKWVPTFGHHTYSAQWDDANRIAESNEANNTLSGPVYVNPARADLVVTKVGPEDPKPTVGTPTRLYALVKNQGSASTPAGVLVGVQFQDNFKDSVWSDNYTQSIEPGQTVKIVSTKGTGASTDGRWRPTLGLRVIGATVDYAKRVPELEERNNSKTTQYTVVPATPAGADLAVTSVTATPTTVVAGEEVAVTITVKNVGTAPLPSGDVWLDWIYVDASDGDEHPAGDDIRSHPDLAVGATLTFTAGLETTVWERNSFVGGVVHQPGLADPDRSNDKLVTPITVLGP